MTNVKTQISKKRWGSLEKNISTTLKQIPEDPQSGQIETLRSLLIALKNFGKSQFEFFYNGFYGEDEKENLQFLEISKSYPPEYILRNTLYQIESDLSVIKRAINQRLHGNEKEALKKADILAYQALSPTITADMMPQTAVITYFHKEASVRVIPYAPVALIGLPLSAINVFSAPSSDKPVPEEEGEIEVVEENDDASTNLRDFLSIPHEIGHYIYWHGRINRSRFASRLSRNIKNQPAWLEDWLEEIFADVYGTFIAGPAMALNFQELQKDFFRPSEFTINDERHPIPAIRPFIYSYALQNVQIKNKLGGNDEFRQPFKEISNDLDSAWNKWLSAHDIVIPEKYNPQDTNKNMGEEVQQVLPEKVKKVIDDVISYLRLKNLAVEGKFWSKEEEGLSDLFSEFASYIKDLDLADIEKLPKIKVIRAEGSDDYLEINHDSTPQNWGVIGNSRLAIDALKKSVLNQSKPNSYKMLPETWLIVFSMRGWTISGPTGNPPVGG